MAAGDFSEMGTPVILLVLHAVNVPFYALSLDCTIRMVNVLQQKSSIEKGNMKAQLMNKKQHFFKEAKTKPPSLRFTFLTILALNMLWFGAATPVNPNGYRPSATKMDFRDVQHNPKLIEPS